MILKRVWTKESALKWIKKVNSDKEKFGLKYISACNFLKIPVFVAKNLKF